MYLDFGHRFARSIRWGAARGYPSKVVTFDMAEALILSRTPISERLHVSKIPKIFPFDPAGFMRRQRC